MDFSPITFDDYKRLKPWFGRQPYELCEYSPYSILAWQNEDYRPLAHENGDTLVIKAEFNDGKHSPHLLLPISERKVCSPIELQDLALDVGVDHYSFVPESYIHQFGKRQVAACFHIREQVGHADYIYLTKDLAELKGNKYSKKRNLINQFERKYVNTGREVLFPIAPDDIADCLSFLEKWCAANDCEQDHVDDLACEKQAVINTLENLNASEANGLLLRIDGDVCAFGIGARLTENMGVLHFQKAFSDVKGLYQYFDKQCMTHLFNGYPYINKENDMEKPGLMKAKKSYHPVKILKSYQLTVR